MDDAARRAIEWDASQLTARFYSHVDTGRYREAGEMFLPDGIWHRLEGAATGPDAVAKALAARDPSRVSGHMINNLTVTVLDPDRSRSTPTSSPIMRSRPPAARGRPPTPSRAACSAASRSGAKPRKAGRWPTRRTCRSCGSGIETREKVPRLRLGVLFHAEQPYPPLRRLRGGFDLVSRRWRSAPSTRL